MPNITITVPTDKADKVYTAYKGMHGDPTENPTAAQKIAFVRNKILDHIKGTVRQYEQRQAEQAAREGIVVDDAIVT